jgi:hypothetical protein
MSIETIYLLPRYLEIGSECTLQLLKHTVIKLILAMTVKARIMLILHIKTLSISQYF